jgi:hypothetical protein
MQNNVLLLNLRTEVIRSSEASVDFQQITRRYILEHSVVHNHGCENPKSYVYELVYVYKLCCTFCCPFSSSFVRM